jgi:putative hydrolase of the HAD superfamily
MVLRAIVFDLDDTLYPEYSYVLSGFGAVAAWADANLGIAADQGFVELRSLFEKGVRGNTFDLWLEGHGLASESSVTKMTRVYREHRPGIEPYPGTVELLKQLRPDYLLGLLTDGYVAAQRKKLAALGLQSYLTDTLFTGSYGDGAGKPSLRVFRIILGRLGVAGGEAIYVGDNPMKDFLGARRAGMGTVRVRAREGIYSDREPPTSAHAPDYEVGDLPSLTQVLPRFATARTS